MKAKIKRTAVALVGVFFILLGLLGLALPFLQGFLFLIIGTVLLSISSVRVRTWVEGYTRKYPKIHAAVEKIEKRILRVLGPLDE